MTNLTVGNGYYQVSVTFGAAAPPLPATYSIVATPIGDQANDLQCATFKVTSTGQQTATGSDPNADADCWK